MCYQVDPILQERQYTNVLYQLKNIFKPNAFNSDFWTSEIKCDNDSFYLFEVKKNCIDHHSDRVLIEYEPKLLPIVPPRCFFSRKHEERFNHTKCRQNTIKM